jgi:hypothetical protein
MIPNRAIKPTISFCNPLENRRKSGPSANAGKMCVLSAELTYFFKLFYASNMHLCVVKHANLLHDAFVMHPRFNKGETTMAMVRMNLQVSAEINELLERIAKDTGTNRSEVIRQALALMKVAQEAKKKGKHIGLVSDADKLDTEIVGLL